jgi:hypothetical protein
MKARNWLILILLALAASAVAEEGCPDGYIPVFQGGTQNRTCVVDYNLPYWQEHSQEPAHPPERWEDRWGAIADNGRGVMGVATNATNKETAERMAINDCANRGGGACETGLTYRSQCAAVAASTKRSYLQGAAYEEDAKRMAMERCTATGEKCWVYYSGCSLPVRVQ